MYYSLIKTINAVDNIKKNIGLLIIAAVMLAVNACQTGGASLGVGENNAADSAQVAISDTVRVYYFHMTRRCATCNAIEDETIKTIKTTFGDAYKKGKIVFASYNIETENGKAVAAKQNVNDQALVIVANGKQKDITNEGFLYARSNPDAFEQVLTEAIKNI